ncbi:MAG: GAF domain-containing protein [Candidatus Omnitrophica bacterium]|nr:GAF domain-containing protein [Candidatus Omnitrophota bacterium]MCB9784202.1 GAF domain-containing protein [Candidatus Omnitrophota bacterium]
MVDPNLSQRVEEKLKGEANYQGALDCILEEFEAATGSIHRADHETRFLHLVVQKGIPEQILVVTTTIPFGKGMAGVCLERAEPVTMCNLQTDDSGVAKPGAKLTQVQGAIVVPIFSGDGETVIGTLGIGKPIEHDYTDQEIRILKDCALEFAKAMAQKE